MINGILYFSVPDHVYALDARTGREIWHYAWKTRGGDHIGNRGVGILDNWLYFLTPDNYFVSLDVATGKERWHHEIANMKREYFSTNAPMIIGRQVIIGVGGDALDIPGYLESRDPESGNLVWRWNTTPRAGEAGANTWPDEDSMAHGGGMPWIPGTYDPELNLYYFGTGNPQPGARRAEPRGRQPLHVLDRRAQPEHRQDGVVLPGDAARHARLGRGADAGPDRRRVQRPSAQDGRAGEPQRALLPARSRRPASTC